MELMLWSLHSIKHKVITLPSCYSRDSKGPSLTCPIIILNKSIAGSHMSSQLWSRWNTPHSCPHQGLCCMSPIDEVVEIKPNHVEPTPPDAKKTLIPIDQEGCFCLDSYMCPTIPTYTFTLQYSIVEHMNGW